MNSKAIDISDFFIEKGVSHLKLHNQLGLGWWLGASLLVFLSETLNGEGRSETLRPFWGRDYKSRRVGNSKDFN